MIELVHVQRDVCVPCVAIVRYIHRVLQGIYEPRK